MFQAFLKYLFVGWALLLFPIATQSEEQPTLPKAPYVLPQTVKQWLADGKKVGFIDVRTPKEFKAGHIEGAVNISYEKIERYIQRINRSEPQVIYCTYSAWRAPYAANTLVDLGFENVHVLEGGISAWRAGGQVIYAMQSSQQPQIISYPPGLKKTLKHPKDKEYKEKINLTLEELSHFDGKDGRMAYVAVNGIVYDVTQSRLWRGGMHDPSKGEATAGRDLTEVIKKAPHGTEHLKDFPVVGQVIP